MKMSDRFGSIPNFDIKEFFEDDQMFAIPNVQQCYDDINKAVNNHDRMVEEIDDLKEALPVIKQMIFSMKTNAHTFSNENVEEVSREGRSAMRLIDKLLAKLNQGGEE